MVKKKSKGRILWHVKKHETFYLTESSIFNAFRVWPTGLWTKFCLPVFVNKMLLKHRLSLACEGGRRQLSHYRVAAS